MKNITLIITFLISIGFSAQNITKLNADLNLTDTLNYDREIRIYKGGGISNYSSIFRMFNQNGKQWSAEFYEHYAKVKGETELKIKKRILKSKNDMEFVFLNFLRSKVLNLPNQKEIEWKIKGRDSIFEINRKRKGKEIVEYESVYKMISVLDGIGYKIQVRDFEKKNEFYYYNPETYLEKYKEIDELIFMSEILNLIRNEFKIWKIN